MVRQYEFAFETADVVKMNCISNTGEITYELTYLTLKAPNKKCSRRFFYFYLLKKIRLDVLCESSALQRIHMKYEVLFLLKNNEDIFMNVVSCSCDWRFKGYLFPV